MAYEKLLPPYVPSSCLHNLGLQREEEEKEKSITDHNVRETLEIVDRAYILHEGRVLMSGTPDEVVQNENVRRVYLGDKFRIS